MSLERIEESIDTPWWGEHDHRYIEALKYIQKNSMVLDLACGSGFGTYKLRKVGQHTIIGGDISDEAIAFCRTKYKSYLQSSKLDFRKLNATKLDFSDATFDAIVSFETLEHITDYRKVIMEFKRVLKPGGILLLSTPNVIVSSPDGVIVNPYHVKEFTLDELQSLLSIFSSCQIGGQQYVRYRGKHSQLAFWLEKFLYLRGVRRLNTKAKNKLMQTVGVTNFYPTHEDYEIIWPPAQVTDCLTFFAVCKK